MRRNPDAGRFERGASPTRAPGTNSQNYPLYCFRILNLRATEFPEVLAGRSSLDDGPGGHSRFDRIDDFRGSGRGGGNGRGGHFIRGGHGPPDDFRRDPPPWGRGGALDSEMYYQ
jgi:hypothetical protein